jgi:hypothetical protein
MHLSSKETSLRVLLLLSGRRANSWSLQCENRNFYEISDSGMSVVPHRHVSTEIAESQYWSQLDWSNWASAKDLVPLRRALLCYAVQFLVVRLFTAVKRPLAVSFHSGPIVRAPATFWLPDHDYREAEDPASEPFGAGRRSPLWVLTAGSQRLYSAVYTRDSGAPTWMQLDHGWAAIKAWAPREGLLLPFFLIS